MSTVDTRQETQPKMPLVDPQAFDLDARVADAAEIERVNPHRGLMRLLDAVVWVADDFSAAVGLHDVPHDPFWAAGHFPSRPTMPGVLMVESGAQLGGYLWNIRQEVPRVAAFLRIDGTVFRRAVVPWERLVLMCREVKCSSRRFVTAIQGMVDGQIAFESQISGMAMEEHRPTV